MTEPVVVWVLTVVVMIPTMVLPSVVFSLEQLLFLFGWITRRNQHHGFV